MHLKSTLLILCGLLLFSGKIAQAEKASGGDFKVGTNAFLLNGKPYIIRAGEIHFPRIPREYWEHRIQMTKALGMNTICIYLFWNFHEEQEGVFDFTGSKDVAEFVRLVQKNGMYCIVRPGPYVCAEWDMGGLPWWLLKKPGIQVRTKDDAFFMQSAKRYLAEVGRQLAPLQIQNGGNIIMMQVENEYGVWGNDAAYMGQLRDSLRQSGFDQVQLFRCDWNTKFNLYDVPGVATTLNFGAGANIEKQFAKFKEVYPEAPLMCSEYWTGWFDHWGRPHETREVSSFIGSLKDMLDRKISFSLYMAHGGTSFGQWGGAGSPPYSCLATSYDYNAPINEAGQPTDKFYAVRDLLKNYLQEGETLPAIPASKPEIVIPGFALTQVAPLFDNLPSPHVVEGIQPMEMFDQGWGRILYRTTLPATPAGAKLKLTELHDWATIYLNGKPVGELDRRKQEDTVNLPESAVPAQLDILVEATGRVTFASSDIIDRKGITQKVELITPDTTVSLAHWQVYNFPVDYAFQAKNKFTATHADGPAWYRGSFTLTKTGDAYLEMTAFGKGMVWVNGHNLGRYWKIGPQQTLYLPGCWLKSGQNEVIVLDLEVPKTATLAGVAKPILDKIVRDESLLHRKKGQKLDLAGETPVGQGSFTGVPGWIEVPLPAVAEGRYLCLEALSAQTDTETRTAISELEVVGEDGKSVSRNHWKILYADSEEVAAGNHSAEKIFDLQETTYWQTEWDKAAPGHPHQVVIDMGDNVRIKTLRYLGPWEKRNDSTIKDYRFFVKKTPFKF